MNCETVDDLAAAYAISAVEPDEERGISEHLATCDLPHAEARRVIDGAAILPAGLEPVAAPPELRARILITAATTPQEHRETRVAERAEDAPARPARRWWQLAPVASAAAAVAIAVAIGLGGWNLVLQGELTARNEVLRAVAAADVAHPVEGSAGRGWLLETGSRAVFIAADLDPLPDDRIYELWLIEEDGSPVAVATIERPDDLTAVTLERALGAATVFAVTIEEERVEAPTGDPVLVAALQP